MEPYKIFKIRSRWFFYTKGGQKIAQGTKMEAEANVMFYRRTEA